VNDLRNPYIAGAPVVETSMFFGREDVFNWIERSLEGKYVDHILVLHGQRRVGKTSVLKQIPNFLPDKYIQVFFDLQGRTNTSLERFLWWLAREIVRTLQQERGIELPRPSRTAFEDDPEYLINEFLPGLKPVLGDQVLLLTFDEFDTLDHPEIQETLAVPLINTLRRLMALEGLSFIFSIGSSGNKLENMQASYTDFFKSALYRKISFLTKDDCTRLITKPVEGVLSYNPKAIDLIYEITSGHPYFTQLMCHELFSLCQKTGLRAIQPEHVDAVLDDVIERGTVNLKFVWDEATDLEKWILASLAQTEIGATTHQLHSTLHGQQIRFSEPDIYSAIIRLRDKDILNRDNYFVVHLLLLWLQRNRPLDRVREELVEANLIANRYLEIADTYRDQGQAEKALENYHNVLAEDPKNLRAQVSIGILQHARGKFEAAAAAFQAAIALDREDIGALTGYCDTCLAWGDQLQAAGKPGEATEHYQEILAFNPNHHEARERLAVIYHSQAEAYLSDGQDEAALIAFQTARNFAPEDADLAERVEAVMAEKKGTVLASLATQAEVAQEKEDWETAIRAVENALLLAEEDKNLQVKLEQLKTKQRDHLLIALPGQAGKLAKEENWDTVISTWEKYLSLDPPDLKETQAALEKSRQMKIIQAKYNQALEKMQAKDYPQAIELLRAVIQVDPGYKESSNLLASAVKSSRKVKPNCRRIAWFAIPILLAAVLTTSYLLIRDRSGYALVPTRLDFESLAEILPFLQATPTREYQLVASPNPTLDEAEVRSDGPTTYEKAKEFADPILASIAERQPTFEEDFSSEQDYWEAATVNFSPFGQPERGTDIPLSNLVLDGALRIQDEPTEELTYEPNGINGFLNAEDFVLQFDFTLHDFSYGSKYFLGFREGENQAYGLEISVTESGNGNWLLGAHQGGDGTTLVSGSTHLNIGQPNQIQLIVKSNQIALYKNGQPLTYLEDDTVTGDRTWMWFSSYKPIDVEIDNLKFWDLEGANVKVQEVSTEEPTLTPTATPPPSWVTDFAEPILAAIAGRQPDFQDDFSDKSGGWTMATPFADWGIGLNYDEGELTISDSCWIFREMWYPDFVAELDYHFLPGTGTGSQWTFKYRHLAGGADASSNQYVFHYSGDVGAGLVTSSTLDRGSVETTQLQGAALRGTDTNHVLVIAKGHTYALFINDRPVFHKVGNPIWPNGAIQFDMDETVAIDNFKIWDISGLSLEATPAP